MKKKQKSLKNINKKTLIIIILTLLIVICIFSNNSYSNVKVSYKTIFTSKGDTLWSIAENEINNNNYYSNEDIRKVVFELKKINNLDTNILSEGTELKIPIYK